MRRVITQTFTLSKHTIFRIAAPYVVTLSLCIGSTATTAYAAFSYEPFNYSGTALAGQNGGSGGTGWGGAWFTTAGSQPNQLTNDGVSLAYPATFQPPLSTPQTYGSHVKTGGTSANASTSRMLGQTIDLTVAGNTWYVSALFRKNRPNGQTANDNILLEFVDSGANRRWGVGIEGATDKPWLNANGSTTPSGPAVTVGDTYFLVAKIVAGAGGSLASGGLVDTAYLKVFGTGYASQVPYLEPVTWDATLTQFTGAVLDRIRVRIDSANTAALPGEVDEIRIGKSWAEAVGTPEPAACLVFLGVFALGGICIRRFTCLAI